MTPLDLTKSHLLLNDLQQLRDGLAKLNKIDLAPKRVLMGLDRALATPQQTNGIELRFVLDTTHYILDSYGKDALPLMRLLQRIDEELEHQEVSQRLVRNERFADLLHAIDQFDILTRIG